MTLQESRLYSKAGPGSTPSCSVSSPPISQTPGLSPESLPDAAQAGGLAWWKVPGLPPVIPRACWAQPS